MNRAFFCLVLFLVFLTGVLGTANSRLRNKLEISKQNEQSLLEGVRYYRTSDSLNVASVGVLQLKHKELSRYNANLAEQIKKLNIKLKRVEGVGSYPIQVIGRVEAKLKDTLVLSIPIKSFTFTDGYLTQRGIIKNDTIKADYTYTDTIIPVLHRVPKKFLFFRYGVKGVKLEVFSKNPKTHITAPTYYSLRRKP